MAKLAESEEKTDEAVNHYKQLIQEFPLSPFSTEANLRVKVLAPEEVEASTESESKVNGDGEQENLEDRVELPSGESDKQQDEGE